MMLLLDWFGSLALRLRADDLRLDLGLDLRVNLGLALQRVQTYQ